MIDDFAADTMVDAIMCIDKLRRELAWVTEQRNQLRRRVETVTAERDVWRAQAGR